MTRQDGRPLVSTVSRSRPVPVTKRSLVAVVACLAILISPAVCEAQLAVMQIIRKHCTALLQDCDGES